MRKGASTRLRIIDEATRQASVRGLAGISLADVAAPAGLSKSGLFKHFDSKEDMQQAVMASAFDRFIDHVWTGSAEAPGRPRLEAVFERWIAWIVDETMTGGCPINGMIMEYDDQPGPLRDYLRERLIGWRRNLVADFKRLRGDVSDAEAWQAVFETKAFVLGYHEAARLLEDRRARAWAQTAFAALLDRIERTA